MREGSMVCTTLHLQIHTHPLCVCCSSLPLEGNLRDSHGPELSPSEIHIFLQMCTNPQSLVSHLVLLHTQLSAGGRFILCYKGPSRPSLGHLSQCLHMALSTKVWALSNSSCTFLACSKAVPSSHSQLSHLPCLHIVRNSNCLLL